MTNTESFEYFEDPAFPGYVWRYATSTREFDGHEVGTISGMGEYKAAGNNTWYPSSTTILDQVLDGIQPTPVADLPGWVLNWENEGGAL